MVMKHGVALLALAAVASLTEAATPIKVITDLKHPVVKSATEKDGKIHLVLEEGVTVKKHHVAGGKVVSKSHHKTTTAKHPVEPKKFHKVKHVDPKKAHKKDAEENESDNVTEFEHGNVHRAKNDKPAPQAAHKKTHHKKVHHKEETEETENDVQEFEHGNVQTSSNGKPAVVAHHKGHKKAHKKTHEKQVSEEKKPNGEIIRKYPHGNVHIMAKPAAEEKAAVEAHHKKTHKKHDVKKVAKETDDSVEEEDVSLEEGETVSLTFGDHIVEVTLLKNGSLIVHADDESYVLPAVDDLDIDFSGSFHTQLDGSDESEDDVGSLDGTKAPAPTKAAESGIVKKVEEDISGVAKKFTEYATKLVGDNKIFTKESAPVIFACGVIGALAAVIGIAALAMGRARDAAVDPQSVLADAAEEDVEAGITAVTVEVEEDVAADESESLDGSESESESDNEEGTFANEVASV